MQKRLSSFAVITLMLFFCGGCESGTGGGTRSITAGTNTTTAVYGWDADEKLGFVIFTDLQTPETIGSASAKWTGSIEPPAGPTIQYKHTSGGMSIDGTEYKFDKGRVFLVSTKEGNVSVSQLDISIGNSQHDAEIDRIVRIESVKEFLSK